MSGRAWLALTCVFAATGTFAAPDIDSISPLAIRPGVPGEITLSGSDLSESTQLWTSFPARVDRVGEARFQINTDEQFGIGALRAFGSNGVSNLGLILVDDLPTVAGSETNKTRATAQLIATNSAVDGRCDELSYDWFKLRAHKGQRVSVETIAARLGSKLDSMLRVINPGGHELVRNDDAPGQSGDSFLSFVAPQTGDYFIELRDVNYSGGSAFFYHLRIGGSAIGAEYLKAGATHVSVSEQEPNDTPANATRISLTNIIRGTFGKPRDRDCYEFAASKGERIELRAVTRSLGSACDAMLQLESTDGKQLARSNPSAADEGVLTHSFASNGTYRLVVEEATSAFGSNMFYQITARPAAGFALTLDSDRVNVAPGKNFELKINIARSDYKGPVTLRADGLPEGFILTNNVIAEGKSNTTMRVTAPDKLSPGTWQIFSVSGTGKRNGTEGSVRASTAPALRKVLPMRLYPPPEFDGEVALGLTSK